MAALKVKICGQTSLADASLSVAAGADYLGVVLNVPWSARSLNIEAAAPIFSTYADRTFALTFNGPVDDDYAAMIEKLNPCALQLTGQERPEEVAALGAMTGAPVYKSIHLKPEGEGGDDTAAILEKMAAYASAGVTGFILDTAAGGAFGGTGKKSDWRQAAAVIAQAPAPVFIAGGIDPENVVTAAAIPGISAIDLASGVEERKGKKSEEKLALLFSRLKEAGYR